MRMSDGGMKRNQYRGRRIRAILVAAAILALASGTALGREIEDMAGRTVEVPELPQHIACIDGPTYEKMLAFGAMDRVAMVTSVMSPWALKLYPRFSEIPVADNMLSPDVEQLLALGTDLVILKPRPKQIKSLTAAGLPVTVAYNNSERQKSMADFLQDYYAQIRFFGRALGGDGPEIAEKYCAYMAGRIGKVLSVTQALPEVQRPRVFYYAAATNGPSGTQSKYTTAWWLVRAAGGEMMTYEDSAYFIDVSTEQMILWDPEFIVVSTGPSVDDVLGNRQFRDVTAIKAGNVLPSPQGVFYWSHFSTESFLLILHLAEAFHPDLFPELDVKRELMEYYATFYHYNLTDDEARRILSCLPPAPEEVP